MRYLLATALFLTARLTTAADDDARKWADCSMLDSRDVKSLANCIKTNVDLLGQEPYSAARLALVAKAPMSSELEMLAKIQRDLESLDGLAQQAIALARKDLPADDATTWSLLAATVRALRGQKETVDDAARAAGISDPFRAELVSAATFGRADESTTSTQQSQSFLIQLASRSFCAGAGISKETGKTCRLTGRLGFVPVATLTQAADPAPTPTPTGTPDPATIVAPEAIDTRAFVWDLRFEYRLHRPHVDMLLFGLGGQSWLLSDRITVDKKQTLDTVKQVAQIVTGKPTAAHFEGGIEVQVFSKEKVSRLLVVGSSPILTISGGVRWDGRLVDPTAASDVASERKRRGFLRVQLAELRVAGGTPGREPFTLRFAFEHERGLGKEGAPPINRLLLGGDLNIFSALGGK